MGSPFYEVWPLHLLGRLSTYSTFSKGRSNLSNFSRVLPTPPNEVNLLYFFRRLVNSFFFEVNDSHRQSWEVKGGQKSSWRIEGINFLLFYLLLFNLFLPNFEEESIFLGEDRGVTLFIWQPPP